MKKDLWHFPRTELAEQVLQMFNIGLSSALTYFAPRRMGKTEFLQKDILPLAEKQKWHVHYFSFLDSSNNPQQKYIHALEKFAEEIGAIKDKPKIKKLSGQAGSIKAEIELNHKNKKTLNLEDIVKKLTKHKKILLLIDEVQALTKQKNSEAFLSNLRTALDINKDTVKVIFTGSSREGLRKVFSQSSAPFFHFGQNLDFPPLNKDFTDHLSEIFNKATSRLLDKNQLWEAFQDLDLVPQLIRSLVERIALNPNLDINSAKEELLFAIYTDRAYINIWNTLSNLEQLILSKIHLEQKGLFSKATQEKFEKLLGIEELKMSTIQSAVRRLEKKNLITKSSSSSHYILEDPNFETWLKQNT